MITSIELTGIGYEVDAVTKKYVIKKIGQLDRYVPRHARQSISVQVKLSVVNKDHGNKYQAEVVLNVPDKVIAARDSTVNMIAAIDIVEAKIINQLRRYKQTTMSHVGRRRLLSGLRRGYSRELQ